MSLNEVDEKDCYLFKECLLSSTLFKKRPSNLHTFTHHSCQVQPHESTIGSGVVPAEQKEF